MLESVSLCSSSIVPATHSAANIYYDAVEVRVLDICLVLLALVRNMAGISESYGKLCGPLVNSLCIGGNGGGPHPQRKGVIATIGK